MDQFFPGYVPLINARTVVYYEETAHPLLNKVLQQYFTVFSSMAREKDYTFIYLPGLQQLDIRSLENLSNQLRYLYPRYFQLDHKGIYALVQYLFRRYPGEKIYERLKEMLGRLEYPKAGFLIFDNDVSLTEKGECRILDFDHIEKNAQNRDDAEEYIKLSLSHFFANQVSNFRSYGISNRVAFSKYLAEEPAPLDAFSVIKEIDPEADFERESKKVEEDLLEQFLGMANDGQEGMLMSLLLNFMEQLKKNNPELAVEIELMLSGNKEIKSTELSRLQLIPTHGGYDYKIVLPDYDMEINMPQLPKTLYLFFLRHPEGVYLHNLIDHKDELLSIYSRFSKLSDTRQVEENIQRLVNFTDNSINVNCARIKRAFLEKVNNKIASHYYVNGKRGHPKKIQLKSNLIDIDPSL